MPRRGRPELPLGRHGNISARKVRKGYAVAQCWVRDHDGVRRLVKRVGSSVDAARQRVQEALTSRFEAGTGGLNPDSRLAEVAELWSADIARQVSEGQLAASTQRQYMTMLNNYVAPAIGQIRCRELRVSHCEALMATVAAKGVATRQAVRGVLAGVCGHAVRHDAMATNPAKALGQIKAAKGSRKKVTALTATQRDKWFEFLKTDEAATRAELWDLTALMLATGVRVGELLAVRIEEIDLKAGTLPVSHHMTPVTGKGLVREESLKAGGDRDLVLPKWARTIVKRRALKLGGQGPLFPTRNGTHRSPHNVARDYREARTRGGFGDEMVTHTLRKTVITELIERGLSTKDAADQAGHSRIATTEEHYVGRDRVGEKAADLLEALDPNKPTGTDG